MMQWYPTIIIASIGICTSLQKPSEHLDIQLHGLDMESRSATRSGTVRVRSFFEQDLSNLHLPEDNSFNERRTA